METVKSLEDTMRKTKAKPSKDSFARLSGETNTGRCKFEIVQNPEFLASPIMMSLVERPNS